MVTQGDNIVKTWDSRQITAERQPNFTCPQTAHHGPARDEFVDGSSKCPGNYATLEHLTAICGGLYCQMLLKYLESDIITAMVLQ